jgi:hypothetical protein
MVFTFLVVAVVVMAAIDVTTLRRATMSFVVVSIGKNSAGCRQCDYSRKKYLFHASLLIITNYLISMGFINELFVLTTYRDTPPYVVAA